MVFGMKVHDMNLFPNLVGVNMTNGGSRLREINRGPPRIERIERIEMILPPEIPLHGIKSGLTQ